VGGEEGGELIVGWRAFGWGKVGEVAVGCRGRRHPGEEWPFAKDKIVKGRPPALTDCGPRGAQFGVN